MGREKKEETSSAQRMKRARSDTNQAVQPHKIARDLKFQI